MTIVDLSLVRTMRIKETIIVFVVVLAYLLDLWNESFVSRV